MAWYFRHDYSARNDRKIAELEMELGENIGYAMWFKLLEIMGEMGGSLPKEKMKVVAYALRVPLDVLLQFVRICVRIGLLTDNDDEYINERFAKECAKIKDTSEKASNSAKIRWSKPEPDPKPELHPAPLPAPILPSPSQSEIAKPKKTNKSDSDNKKLMADVNEIVEAWNNTAKSCKCRKVTNEIIKAAKKRLETYSIEEIKTIILNYQTILQDDNTYFTYSWNLYEFLTRAKSFEYFNDDITVLSAKYRKFDADDSDGQKDGDKWNWSFPQPKEWDNWSIEERKTYIKNNCIKETK